ncbi:MAG: hypothetical protein KAW87_04710, partial [Candidatus Cloacimonetes bacterium]|nr:hypothetical protein [Candidatus Cloacimonadota bacterium]
DLVQTDKDNIQIPQFDTIINKPQIEPIAMNESNFSWLKYWWKPAVVTSAAAALILFAIIFVSSVGKVSINPDYIVFDNEYDSTEACLVNEEYILAFEQYMIEEIYQDEELRDEILYGSWEYIEDIIDLLSDEDIKYFENEINKIKTT